MGESMAVCSVVAALQEFILQSFMFVRLETFLGSRRALLYSSCLFAVAHIPSPALTFLSFLGALFFCEMFRRFRNIYPLGLVHAALGLTIAASLPDSLMHHMRVGLGFLRATVIASPVSLRSSVTVGREVT